MCIMCVHTVYTSAMLCFGYSVHVSTAAENTGMYMYHFIQYSSSNSSIQVWFQNRRAKMRRKDKNFAQIYLTPSRKRKNVIVSIPGTPWEPPKHISVDTNNMRKCENATTLRM